MIILDPFPQALADLRTLARDEGVTSFKLFMAYPNVLMVDDGVCFYVMREAAEHGAVVCVHAENGYAINVLVQEAVQAGNAAPRYHYLTRPPELEGEAHRARDHARRRRGVAAGYVWHVTRAQALHAIAEARDRSDLVHGETCTQYLFLTSEELERPGFEGGENRVHAAAPLQRAPGDDLARSVAGRPLGRVDRPLPVLLRRAALRAEVQ